MFGIIKKAFRRLFPRHEYRAWMEQGVNVIDMNAISRVKYDAYNIDRHLDQIYEVVDRLATEGSFELLDETLLMECMIIRAFLPSFEDDLLLGWVTATLPCKTKLQNRESILRYLQSKNVDVSGL